MSTTLRRALHRVADVPVTQGMAVDPATTQEVTAALGVLRRTLREAWPGLDACFRTGLSEGERERFELLADKLPSVRSAELDELVALGRKGLRLDRQALARTEDELPDDELDAPLEAA